MDTLTAIERARVQLLRKFPYFGKLAMNLKIRVAKDCPTAYTNGSEMVFGDDFIQELLRNQPSSVTGLVLHETLHPALQHLWRVGSRDKNLFNVAADYVVNNIIVESGFDLPKGGLIDKNYAGLSAEEVYEKIYEDLKEKSQGDQGQGDLSQAWDDHSQWDSQEDQKEAEAQKKSWQQRLAAAMQSAKEAGNLPASLARMFGEILEPRVDWRAELASFLQETLGLEDYNKVPDNRGFWAGLYLPSMSGLDLPKVCLAIDTSGSIDEELLKIFLSELSGIMELSNTTITLIQCDCQVQDIREIDQNDLKDLKVLNGGGGTDFRPVFREVEDRGLEPSCLLYFTDLIGSFPLSPPSYPVLWVAPLTSKLSVPFGRLIKITRE